MVYTKTIVPKPFYKKLRALDFLFIFPFMFTFIEAICTIAQLLSAICLEYQSAFSMLSMKWTLFFKRSLDSPLLKVCHHEILNFLLCSLGFCKTLLYSRILNVILDENLKLKHFFGLTEKAFVCGNLLKGGRLTLTPGWPQRSYSRLSQTLISTYSNKSKKP